MEAITLYQTSYCGEQKLDTSFQCIFALREKYTRVQLDDRDGDGDGDGDGGRRRTVDDRDGDGDGDGGQMDFHLSMCPFLRPCVAPLLSCCSYSYGYN